MAQTVFHKAFLPIKTHLPGWLSNPIRSTATAVLAPVLFSVGTGHFRSSFKRAAVSRNGEPLPWYSYPCIDFLTHRPYAGRTVLEFGGGQSTLWWAKRADRVVTLEGDRAWYERISRSVPSSVELHHVPQDNPASCTEAVEAVLRSQDRFDVIVIDGLWRHEMIDIAVRSLTEDGMIVCDDADGYGFHEGFQKYGLNRVDFFGYSPGTVLPRVTSIYFRPTSFGFSSEYPIAAATPR
jgi:hypothetical protein